MEVVRERFLPDGSLSTEAMERMQREIAATAVFSGEIDPEAIRSGSAVVAGIDQAFLDDRAVSAVVCRRGGETIERTTAVTPLSIPYIPGLLAFREGKPIVEALCALETDPDLLMFDGSGRIHFREAGVATHVGVLFDTPAVGVAKSLLCGTPRESTAGLAEGRRVPIAADDSMTAADGEIVGYAYQSRQYPNSRRINPLYVSPGDGLGAAAAVDCVAACGGDYKLPEPIRLADSLAGEATDRQQ
ncbi:MAG: endonuclease V [Natronomonas sp.]